MSDDQAPQQVPPTPPAGGARPQRFVQPYPGAAPVPVYDSSPPPSVGAPSPELYADPAAAPQGAAPAGRPPYAPPPGAYAGYPGAPAASAVAADHRPGPSAPDPRPKTLAIVALCLAVGGALLIFVPFLNLLAAPILIAGFVCALIALIGRRHGGTGVSIAALATSAGTGLIAIVVVAASALLFGLGGLSGWGAPWSPFDPYSDGRTDDGYTDRDWADGGDLGGDYSDPPAGYGAELDLVAGETAFAPYATDSMATWYGVVIENPNPDATFENVDIEVEALDADGAVIDTDQKYLTIPPGTSAIAGLFYDYGDAAVADVRVVLPDRELARILAPGETGEVTVEGVSGTMSGTNALVSGAVVNTFDVAQEYARVVVVARDAQGAIVAVEPGFVDTVPPGGTVPFEVYFYDPLPADAVFEVYVTL
jgi:hypothetical protein